MTPIENAPSSKSRYDAFISYRHVEPDRRWAKWLHTALETYRVPRALARQKGLPLRIGRVFRDEEELPASDNLSAEIESALSQSRCLIVVCSPRTPGSQWVNKEVERFRQFGRHGAILALLIEGEPSEAFPQALREIRHTVVDRDGVGHESVEEVEPLAADVRRTRGEGLHYLRRMARLRVMATLLGVAFDDLRQREQERRMRRLGYVGAMLAVLLCIVGGLALFALSQRNAAVKERQVAETEKREAVAQRQRAELELARGTVLQGDLLGSAGRWVDARARYVTAADLYQQNNVSPLAADLGLWDASRHVAFPLNVLAGHTDSVFAVAISPDGNQVLSGAADKTVRLWDPRSGRLIHTLTGHTGTVRAVAFLPDGKRALSVSDDKSIKLWDLSTGSELQDFAGHAAGISALAVSADGERFITGDSASQVKLWDLGEAKEIRTIDAASPVLCLAMSANGEQGLCAGTDNKVRLFDLTAGTLVQTFAGQEILTSAVAFLPDPKTVFAGGYDNVFRFWDIASGKPLRTFSNEVDHVGSVAMSRDGKSLVAGTWGGMLRSFDVTTGNVRRTFIGHTFGVRQVAIGNGGRIAVSAGSDKLIYIWDLWGAPAHQSWGYSSGPINGVNFTADGLLAFTATGTGRMELWDIATQKTIYTVRVSNFVVNAAVLCPDGRHVLASGLPGAVLVDLSGREPDVHLNGHTQLVESVAVSPDGRYGLTGSYDKSARVWDLSNGKELQSLPHDSPVIAVAFSADGRLAMTAGLDGIHVWDTNSWSERRTIAKPAAGASDACSAAIFSPDGHSILVGTQAGTLKLIECEKGVETRSFSGGHEKTVGCLAFSHDGSLAVSGSDDHTLRTWDVQSGLTLHVLTGHEAAIRSVAFASDGHSILSGDLNGTLKLWSLTAAQTDELNRDAVGAARLHADSSSEGTGDAANLMTALGSGYAFHGLDGWATAMLEKARAGNAAVSPLVLGRCYWKTGNYEGARREWAQAMKEKDAPEAYLKMCLEAMNREEMVHAAPTTAPGK